MLLPRRLNIIGCNILFCSRDRDDKNTSSDTGAACVATALALCLNMSSDTDATCVATALALCLKHVK
jgi:hypothetical protein